MALARGCRWASGLIAAGVLALFAVAARAQNDVYDANQVKAAFLYHFGTYVQWPAVTATDPITIAVLDEPAVVAELERFLPGRQIQGRAVEVIAVATVEEVAQAEILFIGQAHNGRLSQLISTLESRPTLVVTDSAKGLDDGAMVNFQLVNSRVRFEISLPHAEDAGLMLSSRLLSAALRVETSECCWYELEQQLAVATRD